MTGVGNALGAFTYAYVNQTSRLSGVTYPSGTGLTSSYSYFGNTGDQRLQTIQNLKSTTQLSKFDYTYNPVGTIATWTTQADTSTAIVNTLTYDGADQLTSAVQSGGGSASNAYAYDPAGNRLAETTSSGTTTAQFNSVNQLTRLSNSPTSQTVAGYTSGTLTSATINAAPAAITGGTNFSANIPLPAGTNVVSVVAQPSSSTGTITTKRYQVITSGSAPNTLAYDANGNVTTDENGNSYKWDALNRITAVIYNSGSNVGNHTEFAYDGLSRRTKIVERTGTTIGSGTVSSTKNYLWIGSEIVEERNASNAVQKRFFTQGEQQSGAACFYTFDHLGSVKEMCSATGAILSRLGYDPYGRVTLESGTNVSTKQYTGDYYHPTSGLNLTKYRAYDANTGRWLSKDPIGENGGINLYDYVLNRPIQTLDRYGLAIYVCVRATRIPGASAFNHAYFWDSVSRISCGRNGISGGGQAGDSDEKGPGTDSCVKVPGSDGIEADVMKCCRNTANTGFFIPFNNDCHDSVENCLKNNHLPDPGVPYVGPYPPYVPPIQDQSQPQSTFPPPPFNNFR